MIPAQRINRLHFIGIGGAGMSGMAEILHENGFCVTGSDMADGGVIDHMRSLGIAIYKGHDPSHIEGAQVVVHSSAVRPENVEFQASLQKKIPVIRRAEMLGELMRLKYTLAVAGTHGKTTTTSILGHIWEKSNLDPTVIVGGVVMGRETGARLGRGRYLVAEADEYDRSFLAMMPTVAIITNIDADHLDCYRDLDEIKDAFVEFSNKVPFYGQVVCCIDDAGVQDIVSRIRKPIITYGFSRQADYIVQTLGTDQGFTNFSVKSPRGDLGVFKLPLAGRHNVSNAVAAIAVACEEGVEPFKVREALESFGGVARRFQLLGEGRGIRVYDDYAHHPTEVAATLQGARELYPQNRIVVLFQPHLYTRTRDHQEAFGAAFMNSDVLLVCDIYGSREQPIADVHGSMVCESARRRGHHNTHFVGARQKGEEWIIGNCQKDDIVICMGAGNINQSGRALLEGLRQ